VHECVLITENHNQITQLTTAKSKQQKNKAPVEHLLKSASSPVRVYLNNAWHISLSSLSSSFRTLKMANYLSSWRK